MSDEQRKEEEAEVEGHVRTHKANEEPEVEGHVRTHKANDEHHDEADDDVEAHVRKVTSARMDNIRHI